jgi:hypothetical protein
MFCGREKVLCYGMADIKGPVIWLTGPLILNINKLGVVITLFSSDSLMVTVNYFFAGSLSFFHIQFRF